MIGVLFMESARPEAKHHKSTSVTCCLATGPPRTARDKSESWNYIRGCGFLAPEPSWHDIKKR
jgi:hypothetical protein